MEPMEREPIVDDQVFKVSFADNVDYLSPNYDKIDFFPGFGHYIQRWFKRMAVYRATT